MKRLPICILTCILFQISFSQVNYLNIKVFIEGPYFNGQMTPFLNVLGQLPLSQPYNTSPWNYKGGEGVPGIPNTDIVDWILVDVFKAYENSKNELVFELVGRKAGFLLKNGQVTGLDGDSYLTFYGINQQSIYVGVNHRNHLAVISSIPIIENEGIYSYDFSISGDQSLGGNNTQKQLSATIWGMIAADGNASGQIDNIDKNEVWLPQENLTGYYPGDFNLDTQVDEDDIVANWIFNVGKGSYLKRDTILAGWNCGDSILDTRDNKKYSTILIGNQCWMAENLNIGSMITGGILQSDNEIFEKYCYDNLTANCDTYGGLYQWDETMQYTTSPGTQGICPDNWHVPTDGEWFTMENFVDPSINDPSLKGWRGSDGGTKLKVGGSSGFDALFAGAYSDGSFISMGIYGIFRTSSLESANFTFYRAVNVAEPNIYRNASIRERGYSVRCLLNTITLNNPPNTPSNPKPDNGSIGIVIDTTLSWVCSDPDGDDLIYNIYFGTESNPPLIQIGYTDTTYELNLLDYNTVYYWKIVAYDIYNDSTEGPIWQFTTKASSFTCGDDFTDERDGQIYSTVLIGEQCWMAENLNIGVMISAPNPQTDNDTIEKYCYDNVSSNCDSYGGLYQWDETMQYTTTAGTQGICPDGWHVPTDAEWFTMENFVDTTIDDPLLKGWRGIDGGTKLKEGGSSGFEVKLSGEWRIDLNTFELLNDRGWYRTSSLEYNDFTFYRAIDINYSSIYRNGTTFLHGYSVRCLKD